MPYLAMQDGTKIYYEDTGKDKKQTVLFAHDLNSSHLKVKTFLDQFRKDYHVVCYDKRGHEASDRAIKKDPKHADEYKEMKADILKKQNAKK